MTGVSVDGAGGVFVVRIVVTGSACVDEVGPPTFVGVCDYVDIA